MNGLADDFRSLMQPPERDPNTVELAGFYDTTPQNLRQLCKRHGIAPATFESPSCAFIELANKGADSPLRRRLSDPAEQARIQELVYQWYATEHTKRIHRIRKAPADLQGAV